MLTNSWLTTMSLQPSGGHRRLSSGFHMPERSGLRSARRGAGAVRSTAPFFVRGTRAVGYFTHCADSGSEAAIITAAASTRLMRRILEREWRVFVWSWSSWPTFLRRLIIAAYGSHHTHRERHVARGRRRSGLPAALCAPRYAAAQQPALRMRPRTVRRVHRARGQPRGALVLVAGVARSRQ